MSDDYKRFVLPILFSAAGIILTLFLTRNLTLTVTGLLPTFDLITAVDGTVGFDVNFLLLILIPIFFIEFIILTLPIALILLVIARMFRFATYNIDIMNIGHGFDWFRIMKRSVVPALFALSLGEIVNSLLQGLIFRIPQIPEGDVREVIRSLHPLLTMLGALIGLVVSIAIFSPTWILNDAGIVAHVKPDHLEMRRCPDTEGVGRWYSNLVGGFGILAFPITMFNRYFFQKFVVVGVDLEISEILVSLGWTIGLPFMLMAFLIPIIIINELTIGWTSKVMRRIAKRLGASDVQLERVNKVKTAVDQGSVDHQNSSDSMEQRDIQ
ncbi:MAG: hypothetical protein ACFFFO_11275 [Candidatus Thorarchaeota archaeon]